MSVTIITHLHAAAGQQDTLVELATEGRSRMRAAEGCESFDLLHDQDDPCALLFLQQWVSHAAHDTAFAEKIAETGHIVKVLAALDQPIVQHAYHLQA